jgi:hypothetical protein
MELGFHVLLHQQSIESLTGPKEVWSLNGYDSPVEQEQVAENYGKNPALIAALNQILQRKNNLTSEPVNVFTNYWQGLSRGTPWNMGRGRFLLITLTKNNPKIDGTVFESDDGTRLIVSAVQTRNQVEALPAATNSETNVFVVRPYWSTPTKDWIAADPPFWNKRPAASAK